MRILETFSQKLYIAFNRYYENELTNHAGAVAYYFLLSIIPIILVMLTIFDTVLKSYPGFSRVFFEFLTSISAFLNEDFLHEMGIGSKIKGAFSVFGVLNLLWMSRLILNSFQRAFDVIFPSSKSRNFFMTNIISIFIIPGLFIVITAFVLLRFAAIHIENFFMSIGFSAGLSGFLRLVGLLIPASAAFAFAFFTYRFLPVKKPSNNAALQGAGLFIVLVMVLKLFYTLFTQTADLSMIYGFIGTVILLLLWVYFACQLFFICAEFTYVSDSLDLLVINKILDIDMSGGRKRLESFLFGRLGAVYERYADYHREGEVLFHQGDESKTIYYVYTGSVEIRRAGTPDSISSVRKGEIFGEMAYLIDCPRTATAVAAENSVIFSLDPDLFDELLRINHALSYRIINILSKRLKATDEKVF
ncbi:YhjD/YihY/BrkB family envelope integrity protein [Limisalsivibrio acetivorans]|uniref:YhjD/YihY/BrkB family envelope integrity protein n=1 Tax=Limisalsivibrio acetivorans TaxID=1304888 RepID=UPI0003B569DF|nr:YhjD/YihY/BrkB family envelope integrity protein [Limisalsivibrio acetivorans]